VLPLNANKAPALFEKGGGFFYMEAVFFIEELNQKERGSEYISEVSLKEGQACKVQT